MSVDETDAEQAPRMMPPPSVPNTAEREQIRMLQEQQKAERERIRMLEEQVATMSGEKDMVNAQLNSFIKSNTLPNSRNDSEIVTMLRQELHWQRQETERQRDQISKLTETLMQKLSA